MRCKITGLSMWDEWRLRRKAARLRLNAPVEIAVKVPLRPHCRSSLWYGGDAVVIGYKSWQFIVAAVGDVCAELTEKRDPDHVLAYIKDKGNHGEFGDELCHYVHSDRELADLLEDAHPDYRLFLMNGNWWECFAIDPGGSFHDMMWALDDDDLFGAVLEALGGMDEMIDALQKSGPGQEAQKNGMEKMNMDMDMKLRLVLFEACDRCCPGCCNHDWDLKNLPVCTDYTPYKMIMLTGGEPMLPPEIIHQAVQKIRAQTGAPIYLYTAKVEGLDELLPILDGVTVTLHEPKDLPEFQHFVAAAHNLSGKSLRLNVFREAGPIPGAFPGWIMKEDMEWIPNCPLPEGEVLMRYMPAEAGCGMGGAG